MPDQVSSMARLWRIVLAIYKVRNNTSSGSGNPCSEEMLSHPWDICEYDLSPHLRYHLSHHHFRLLNTRDEHVGLMMEIV